MDKEINMNCPKCGKPMQQESQSQHSIRGYGKQYNWERKAWHIPDFVDICFVKSFWCMNDGCSMKDVYIYHDEPNKYIHINLMKEKLKEIMDAK